MIELTCVEMQIADLIGSNSPNHGLTQPLCKSSFKIDAASRSGKIRDHKFGQPDRGDYLVVNFVVVFLFVYRCGS